MKKILKKRCLANSVLSLLSDREAWTIASLRSALDAAGIQTTSSQLRKVMSGLRERELIKVDNRSRLYHAKRYQFVGMGTDGLHGPWLKSAQRADDMDDSQDDPVREADLDRHHRSGGAWWPPADPTIVAAMFALVRVSRSGVDTPGEVT
ncbi:hypothetical protein [Burkholderia ubonensis]|uniref:hypothetical protein n=1 Tax=Burkholderia ubonensis TaxID=101571 RepID=UPI0012F89E7F|nr:hypothetical protein [Burkholderia ubonensis]